MQSALLEDVNAVGIMMERLSALWKTRAAVNQEVPDYWGLSFDPEKFDFSESLLPFRNHPVWTNLPDELRTKCLSYAWGIYNLKTIYIECDVVTPSCEDVIKAPPASANRMLIQDLLSAALLDEALHTRMSILACNYIYDMRKLPPLEYTDFNLVKWRDRVLSECGSEGERRLTRFAIACASETLITDYLKTMAEDRTIQAVCNEVTRTHAMDEWSHSSVFSVVATDIVRGLGERERKHLRQVILRTVQMFANNELGAWETVFSMLKIPGSQDLVRDIGDSNEIGIYTQSVQNLLDRIGLAGADVGEIQDTGRSLLGGS